MVEMEEKNISYDRSYVDLSSQKDIISKKREKIDI